MIRINLLSPNDKENFKWEKVNNLIKGWTVWMLLAQAMFFVVFIFAFEYLKIERNAVAFQLEQIKGQSTTKEMNSIEKDLSVYTKKIDDISALKDSHLHWSYVLEEIIDSLPDGAKLNNISAVEYVPAKDSKNKEDKVEKFKVDLSGNALTRKDLLSFEQKLKSSDLFFNLEYSDSNYVKSTDVDFRYSFYVYKKDLLK